MARGRMAAHLMVVSYHTALLVAAAAQALQTLAAVARSLRGRWRKMSANTSSGSFSAMLWLGVLPPLPQIRPGERRHPWAQEGSAGAGV